LKILLNISGDSERNLLERDTVSFASEIAIGTKINTQHYLLKRTVLIERGEVSLRITIEPFKSITA
jgi:hypothetical protein